jgi:hypothetical protein
MSVYDNKPEPFFEVVVHEEKHRGLTALSAGYELGKFRNDELATYQQAPI